MQPSKALVELVQGLKENKTHFRKKSDGIMFISYIVHLIIQHNICVLYNVYTIICGQANSPVDHSASLLLGAFARIPLSSHPGGIWLEAEHVVHTRQEGGPLPTHWPPSPATSTSNSLLLSSKTWV